MKTLYIIRHAKAVSRDKGFPDFGRSLVKHGVKTSKKMAKKIKKGETNGVVFVSSPANRALETAHIFAKRMDYPVTKIVLKDVIYEGNTGKEFLTLIQGLEDNFKACFFFGHDPGISEFATLILKDFTYEIPKAGIICVEFATDNWKSISQNNSSLKFFQFPLNKTQKAEYDKKVMKDIRSRLMAVIEEELIKIDADAALQVKSLIKKNAEKIALNFMDKVSDYYQLIAESELKSANDKETDKKPVKKEKKSDQPVKQEQPPKPVNKEVVPSKPAQPKAKTGSAEIKQPEEKKDSGEKENATKSEKSDSTVVK